MMDPTKRQPNGNGNSGPRQVTLRSDQPVPSPALTSKAIELMNQAGRGDVQPKTIAEATGLLMLALANGVARPPKPAVIVPNTVPRINL